MLPAHLVAFCPGLVGKRKSGHFVFYHQAGARCEVCNDVFCVDCIDKFQDAPPDAHGFVACASSVPACVACVAGAWRWGESACGRVVFTSASPRHHPQPPQSQVHDKL